MTIQATTRRMLLIAAGAAALSVASLSSFLMTGQQARAETLAFMSDLFGKKPTINTPGLRLGAYDPHGDFKDDGGVSIEHLFVPWEDVELASLSEADAYARARNRTLLITVEPWSWDKDWRLSPAQLKDGILAGRYDPNVAAICKAVAELKSEVTLRWGQEMETKVGHFTWSDWAPKDYIAAYRRFVDHCRPLAPSAKFMWSPKGEANLADYYPGDNYADVIGLSVFGLQKYDNDKFGHERTFSEMLSPGYTLAAKFNKPIIVAELGYVGEDPYKTALADSVTKIDPQFPLLTSVVYFNDREVHAWPDPYGLPNWRVVPGDATN